MKRTILIAAALTMVYLVGCSGMEVLEDKPATPSPITEVATENPKIPESITSVNENPEPDNVQGNGTDFVKVGDRVYYREYDSDAMDESVLWGDLHGGETSKGKRYIKYFDVKTGDVQTAFEDEGYGVLSYYNGLFYFNGPDGYYTVSEDGSNKTALELEGEYSRFTQIIDNYLFYTDSENDENCVKYLDIDTNKTVYLCPIPESELGYPQITQIALNGDDAYVGISYIAGTGHFFQGGCIYKASLSAEYEPELFRDMSSGEEKEYVYFGEDGKISFGTVRPESAYIDDTDVWVCDRAGNTKCFYENFISDKYSFIKDYAESLSYLGGSVYVIKNTLRYTKEYDIGWRESYRVIRSSNIRISDTLSVNEFNIVKGKPETIPANVYYIHEVGEDGATQILYQPLVVVQRDDRELCDILNIDPDDDEQFLESFHVADPYYSVGYVAPISDNLTFSAVDWESPAYSSSGDKDFFISYMLKDEYDIYTMLSLTELHYDEWRDYYEFPNEDEDSPLYRNIYAYITFSEDGKTITDIREEYLP